MDVRSRIGGASFIVTRLGARWSTEERLDDMGVLVGDDSKNLAKLARFRASLSIGFDMVSPQSPRAMERRPKRFIETR